MSQQERPKVIGIPAWAFSDGTMFGIKKDYIEYARYWGNVRVLSIYDDVYDDLDLLILPGGPDVNPLRYDQIPGLTTGAPNVFLEAFDKYHLPAYVENNTPILGICRGMQTLNVHFGGTLYQEIGAHPTSKRETEPAHELTFVDRYTKLKNIKEFKVGKVTSRHHQGLEIVADCFQIVATHEDIPEVIAHKTKNIAGVQYHPESNVEDTDNFTTALVSLLLGKNLNKWMETLALGKYA